MSSTKTVLFLIAGVSIVATPVLAQPNHHRRHYRYGPAQPDGSGEPYGYRNAPYPQAYGGYYGTGSYGAGGSWEAQTNARLTAQAYRDPGVTLELDPTAKQTATGGPVGGLPGRGGF